MRGVCDTLLGETIVCDEGELHTGLEVVMGAISLHIDGDGEMLLAVEWVRPFGCKAEGEATQHRTCRHGSIDSPLRYVQYVPRPSLLQGRDGTYPKARPLSIESLSCRW